MLFSQEEIQKMRDEIKVELLQEIKKELVSLNKTTNYKRIRDIADSCYTGNGRVYHDLYRGAFSNIVRDLFEVNRLEQLNEKQLDEAIKMSEEIAGIIKKYKNKDNQMEV
jgi:hypothetical protein